MKYFLIIAAAFLPLFTTIAQNKTLEIQGAGEMQVSPDMGVLYLNLNAHDMEFGDAVNRLGLKEKRILKKIKDLGYDPQDVKTTNFSVRENIIWRNGTRIDSGYIASQSMVLDFSNTKKNIGAFLDAFQGGKTEAEISFSFKLSDELRASTTEKVLEKAVQNAKKNAELLAKFSGVELGGVSRIAYHTASNMPSPMYKMESASFALRDSGAGSDGFQAQDITVSDEVTLHFAIK